MNSTHSPASTPVASRARPQTLRSAETGDQHLFRRGKRGTFWFRRRIPSDLVGVYRGQRKRYSNTSAVPKEVTGSLGTADYTAARARFFAIQAQLEADFARCRARLTSMPDMPPLQRLGTLPEPLMDNLAASWLGSMLHADEQSRRAGLDDDAFDTLSTELTTARADLGKLLARGQVEPILPAFQALLHLHRFDASLDDEAMRAGAYRLLRTVVAGLDLRLQRQAGVDVPTPSAPAAVPTTAVGGTWDECLKAWQKLNPDLTSETFFSMQTAWRSLRDFASRQGVPSPGLVTRETVVAWAKNRRFTEGKSAKTVNEQRRKLRLVYVAAVSEQVVKTNPVVDIETYKTPKRQKAVLRRLPFSDADLTLWFSHPIFVDHARSSGQGGEATYWLPLLMFYTGARPEEIAGLDVTDVRESSTHGHYLRITDLPDADDAALFWDRDDDPALRRELIANAPAQDQAKRGIKNAPSRRSIPVASELIKLGFLDYLALVKAEGHKRLFPSLKPSCKNKVSDALLKMLGRCLRDVGITDARKTMYSFRHTMKMLLEEARVEPKLLKRILGHASGDGSITDGYGVELPLGVVAEAFSKVKFPAIPATHWQPGVSSLRKTSGSKSSADSRPGASAVAVSKPSSRCSAPSHSWQRRTPAV